MRYMFFCEANKATSKQLIKNADGVAFVGSQSDQYKDEWINNSRHLPLMA
jgi:hypothetical protein